MAARLRGWTIAAAIVTVLAVAAKLPAEGAGIGDGWSDATDLATIRTVLVETDVGPAWAVRAGCALLLLTVAALSAKQRLRFVAIVSGLALLSLALQGHATMHQGGLNVLNRVNDALHVLSGGAWLGSLAPVLVILAMSRHGQWREEAPTALRGFSRAGHVAVVLVLLSGVLSTVLILGRWPVDLASPYEALLDLKIICVLAMVALALLNRYVLLPRLGQDPAGAGRLLRLGTLAELPIGLAVIALVAGLGLLDPG